MLSQEKIKMKNTEKNAQDLERYEIIVNYFNGDPDRIPNNKMYLNEVMYSLKDCLNKIKAEDENKDIQEKIHSNALVKKLYTEIKALLSPNKDSKINSGTGTGAGVFI